MKACTREIWWILVFAVYDITLSIVHTLRDQPMDTADALGHYHLKGDGVKTDYISPGDTQDASFPFHTFCSSCHQTSVFETACSCCHSFGKLLRLWLKWPTGQGTQANPLW